MTTGLAAELQGFKTRTRTRMQRVYCPSCGRRLYDVINGTVLIKNQKRFYTVFGGVIVDCECGNRLDDHQTANSLEEENDGGAN